MAFKLKTAMDRIETRIFKADSTADIPANSFVTVNASGVVVAADSTSTKISFTTSGSPAGEDKIDVVIGDNYTVAGDATVNYDEATHTLIECDLAVVGGEQVIDLGNTSTQVLKVVSAYDGEAYTQGSSKNIEVKPIKPIL